MRGSSLAQRRQEMQSHRWTRPCPHRTSAQSKRVFRSAQCHPSQSLHRKHGQAVEIETETETETEGEREGAPVWLTRAGDTHTHRLTCLPASTHLPAFTHACMLVVVQSFCHDCWGSAAQAQTSTAPTGTRLCLRPQQHLQFIPQQVPDTKGAG